MDRQREKLVYTLAGLGAPRGTRWAGFKFQNLSAASPSSRTIRIDHNSEEEADEEVSRNGRARGVAGNSVACGDEHMESRSVSLERAVHRPAPGHFQCAGRIHEGCRHCDA